jgi:hypothetical protein
MINYTPLVISRNDKNKQLTLWSQHKLALTAIYKLFALSNYRSPLKVGGNEKQGGLGRSQMLCNGLGLFTIWTRSFWIKIIFPFLLSRAKWISDYFVIKGCGTNNLARAHRSFLRQWRCGQNSQRKLWTRFELADFFLVRAVSLFTLRTFGAQINWRIISREDLFDPHRFLSNKSPIHFAGESGKGNMFLSGKWHVQNKNGHRSPWSQTYAQQL